MYWPYKLYEEKKNQVMFLFDLMYYTWILSLWENLVWLEFKKNVFLSFGITLYLLTFSFLSPYEWGGKYL